MKLYLTVYLKDKDKNTDYLLKFFKLLTSLKMLKIKSLASW